MLISRFKSAINSDQGMIDIEEITTRKPKQDTVNVLFQDEQSVNDSCESINPEKYDTTAPPNTTNTKFADESIQMLNIECGMELEHSHNAYGQDKHLNTYNVGPEPQFHSQKSSSAMMQLMQSQRGDVNSFQSDFATVYKQGDNLQETTVEGLEIADKLYEYDRSRYQQKFVFERAQYHQCIPNPIEDNGFITVQIVKKQLKNTADLSKADKKKDKSLQFQRYNLVLPKKTELGGKDTDEALNAQERLIEDVDVIFGIEHQQFAGLEKECDDIDDGIDDNKDIEIAIIGFWNLKDGTFKCVHSFMIPNPMKDQMLDAEGVSINKVLFGRNPKEMFFFFEKWNEEGDAKELYVGLLNLKSELFQTAYKNRFSDYIDKACTHLDKNCTKTKIADESILSFFVKDFNETVMSQQEQIPDPVLLTRKGTTMIVFVAYLQQLMTSFQVDSALQDNPSKECHFPTIFFFNIQTQLVEWEIKGAEIFIALNANDNVYFMTNDSWFEWSQQELYITSDEERLKKTKSRVNIVDWGINPPRQKDDFHSDQMAPKLFLKKSYQVYFGTEHNLSEAVKSKVFEVHMHMDDTRLSILYHGIGSFTFDLRDLKPMKDKGLWEGTTLQHKQFTCKNIEFGPNKLKPIYGTVTDTSFIGQGKDEDGNRIDVKGRVLDSIFKLDKTKCSKGHAFKTVDISGDHKCSFCLEKIETPADASFKRCDACKCNMHHHCVEKRDELKQNGEEWFGSYVDGNMSRCLDMKQVKIDQAGNIQGSGFDSEVERETQIKGSIGKFDISTKLNFQFEKAYKQRTDESNFVSEVIYFRGVYDKNRGTLDGTWGRGKDEIVGECHFYSMKMARVCIRTYIGGYGNFIDQNEFMSFDTQFMRFITQKEAGKGISMTSIGHVNNCTLTYFISSPDVQLIRDGNDAYVQAKLTAKPDSATGENDGFIATRLSLFNVNGKQELAQSSDLSLEPDNCIQVKFQLNQTYLTTQEKSQSQLWLSMPIQINKQKKVNGAIVYKEVRTGETILEFFTSSHSIKQESTKEDEKEYPQMPLQQEFIIEYPLLAYKHFGPENREICIIHLAKDQPQKVINLGEWEFVNFVIHTQMAEKKIFKQNHEGYCNIMFLVQRKLKRRLMCLKSNPWANDIENVQMLNVKDLDSIYLFSGVLYHKHQKRFEPDNLQTCELMTKTVGKQERYMFIVQYKDAVIANSLNDKSLWTMLTGKTDMVRRHTVRGYKDRIYYAERTVSADKIFRLKLTGNLQQEIVKSEIYNHIGAKIAAFETDCENIQDDTNCTDRALVKQAFYILDDNVKITHLVQDDGLLSFHVDWTIDFSNHRVRRQIIQLRDQDWAHVHITKRALTIDGTTFSLQTNLSFQAELPNEYFGQQRSDMNAGLFDDNDDLLTDWTVLSSLNIPKTSSLVAVAERGYKEFCFIMKPSPGTRKIDIISSKQIPDIEDMFFASNNHVLIKFKYGKSLLCMTNGSVIDIKDERLRGEFFENSTTGKIIGQSVMENDTKYLSFQQRQEDLLVMKFQDNAKVSFVARVEYVKKKVKQIIKDGKISELEKEVEAVTSKVNGKSHDNQARIITGYSKTQNDELANDFSVTTKLAKCNLIRTVGELIIIAASIQQSSNGTEAQRSLSDEEVKQSGNGDERLLNYRIYEVKNEVGKNWSSFKCSKTATTDDFKLKVISFTCKTQDEQNALIESTQFEIVGPYLVFRNKMSHRIKIIELPLENMYLKTGKPNLKFFSEEKQRKIDLNKMLKSEKVDHIKFYSVPKSSYRYIKSQELTSTKLNFYSSLLQVVMRDVAVIYNLDPPIKGQESFVDEAACLEEVDVISSMDQFVDPEAFVNTGFQSTVSMDDEDGISTFIRNKSIRTNEYNNLCFGQESLNYPEGRLNRYEKVCPGILYRTYTELALLELKKINKSLQNKQIDKIDPYTILATFGGYSIFSIYSEEILVLEQIQKQLAEVEFEDEMNRAGQIVEDSYLRRLIQILTQPQSTLFPKLSDEEKPVKNWLQTCWSALMRERITEATASKGFNSILHKSVHYTNTRVRDCLMNITMLSKENTLNMFTDNLIELQILFETMSPTVNKYFENVFLQTAFCQNVSNADWSAGETLYIFQRNSQIINEQETNAEITAGHTRSRKGTGRQNRPILLKMLRIDWIFRSGKGFGGLVQTLAKAKSESFFSTELVITLTENFWSEYKHTIIKYCLGPFIVYFFSTMIYFSYFLFLDFETSQTWQWNGGEFACRSLLIVLMVYFCAFEFLQLFSKGLRYFLDFWNIFDCVSMILNTFMLINHLAQMQLLEKEQIIILSFVAMFIMWIKTAQWFRLFDKTSFYIRLIVETIVGIKYFLFIIVFTQCMFANIIYILDSNRQPEEKLFQVAFGNPIADAFLNQYLLFLGDFITTSYTGSNNVIIWSIFVFATFFSLVMTLNMLIAIMGDTFDAVTENSQQASLAEKVQILNDFVWVVSLGQKSNDKKYFFAASPSQLQFDENATWEGEVGAIKQAFKVSIQNQSQRFLKKLKKVNNKVEEQTDQIQEVSIQARGVDMKVEDMQSKIKNQLTDFAKQINQLKNNSKRQK